jgi:hypothetical protein
MLRIKNGFKLKRGPKINSILILASILLVVLAKIDGDPPVDELNLQLIESMSKKDKRFMRHTADHMLMQKSIVAPKPVSVIPKKADISEVKISEDSLLNMSMDEVYRIAEKAPKIGNETTEDKVVNFLQQQ